MEDMIDKKAKEHCLILGGKQDHGFFPLLKNMGIDLKYNLELSELYGQITDDEQFLTYDDLLFWNGIFYYYERYMQEFDVYFNNDIGLYIKRCEVLNLIIAIFGSISLLFAIIFVSTFLKTKLSGNFMALKYIFKLYPVDDIMGNRYTISYLQKFKNMTND